MTLAFAEATARKLLVATTNPNKLKELRPVLEGMAPRKGAPYTLVTLADVGPVPEPEETGGTFWENARIKALAYAQATGLTTVAEDSGLVIDALGGEPGVHSARFFGANATYPGRFTEIYRRLNGRSSPARFVTALAMAAHVRLKPDSTLQGDATPEILFETETIIEGTIAPAPAGDNGFGYDPIFYYPPFNATTAELTSTQKTSVSHRARAFRDLARFLHTQPR